MCKVFYDEGLIRGPSARRPLGAKQLGSLCEPLPPDKVLVFVRLCTIFITKNREEKKLLNNYNYKTIIQIRRGS